MSEHESAPEPAEDFAQSFDAMVWAKAFVAFVQAGKVTPTDEGGMVGWFANAIMRGYDEYPRRHPEPADKHQCPLCSGDHSLWSCNDRLERALKAESAPPPALPSEPSAEAKGRRALGQFAEEIAAIFTTSGIERNNATQRVFTVLLAAAANDRRIMGEAARADEREKAAQEIAALKRQIAVMVDQDLAAIRAHRQPEPRRCVCGAPAMLGVVHRTDGPCWVPAQDQMPDPGPSSPTPPSEEPR